MSSSTPSATIVNNLFSQVQSMVANRTFTVELFIDVMFQLMQLVEQMSSLTGAQKKALVITVLNKVIAELPISADLKSQLQFLMQAAIPYFINLVVSVENGIVNIEKKFCAKIGCI